MWRAYWLFDASGGAVLNATRVYDGFDRIRNFEPISVSGDHARGIDPVSVPEYKRNWIEWNPEAMYPTKPSWGISITLYVEFERADTSRLLVTAAGVDLKVG
jgi:hypothetical protein